MERRIFNSEHNLTGQLEDALDYGNHYVLINGDGKVHIGPKEWNKEWDEYIEKNAVGCYSLGKIIISESPTGFYRSIRRTAYKIKK